MIDQLYGKLFSHVAKLNITRETTYRALMVSNDEQGVNDEFIGETRSVPIEKATIWLEEMMASSEIPEITWQNTSGMQLPELTNLGNQTDFLIEQLNLKVSGQVFDEINSYIDEKVEKKFAAIDNSYNHYYRSVVNLKEELDQNLAKEELDNSLDEFFKKVSPGLIAMDFRVIWTFEDIEKEYNEVVSGLQFGKHGYVFERYIFSEPVFQYLVAGLSYPLVNELIPLLKEYADIFRQIEMYSENSSSDNYGIFVTNLIQACSVRFEEGEGTFSAEGMTDYEKKLVISLQEAWDKLLQAFELAIDELKKLYKFTLLSLFGGLILNVTDDFRALALKIKSVSFAPLAFESGSDLENISGAISDFNETIEKTIQLKAEGDLSRVIQLSDDVCRIVKADELLKACHVSPFGSAIYVAGLNRYAIIASYLWDIRETNHTEFVSLYEHLYSLLDVIVNDEDAATLEAPSQNDLFAHYLHLLVNSEEFNLERTTVIFDYLMQMVNRYENGIFYQGEVIADDNEFYTLLVLAAQFVGSKGTVHPFINICNYSDLSKEAVEPILSEYKKDFFADNFYKHFQSSIATKLMNIVFK